MYKTDKQKLDLFIKLRSHYIDLLNSKLINKDEFNIKNNNIFNKINLRPFSVLDSFNKALYNYNYYNSKAKLFLVEENKQKRLNNKKKEKIARNNKLNCYYHKDLSIIAMIDLEEDKYIEAYYVNMHSKVLNNKIYEIYFFNKDKVILHTKNDEIKNLLKSKNLFSDLVKDSLIASYINN